MNKIIILLSCISFLLADETIATYKVEGMMCETGCAWKVQSVIKSLEGVSKIEVDFKNKTLMVEYDDDKMSDDEIVKILMEKTTYIVKKIDDNEKIVPMNWFKKIINS